MPSWGLDELAQEQPHSEEDEDRGQAHSDVAEALDDPRHQKVERAKAEHREDVGGVNEERIPKSVHPHAATDMAAAGCNKRSDNVG